MSDIIQEALQEIFVALTTRWRKENGVLAIGVSRKQLLKAGSIEPAVLEDLLKKLKENISSLGLELLEYLYEGESWYAIRSSYVAPADLKSEEEAVLAIIIAHIESIKESKKEAPLANIKKKLVGGKYFSEYQFDRILRNLEQSGYIERKKNNLAYSPRTLIELPEDARKHICEESSRLIF
ncbi:MAG: hypothetical protein HUU50_13910 [Candidatus Brocadiae bacterium]|nr:hypothetical protein [Candidatus Brocadiia bacterium]